MTGGGFKGGEGDKENLLRRSRRKHERVSEPKSSTGGSGVLVSLHVWPNLNWERKLRNEGPTHKKIGSNKSE